jgi:hypothetical protein
MSVVVKGLADAVRKAKAGIDRAGATSTALGASAANLDSVVTQVEGMKNEDDATAAELQAALGTTTNGGPPLDDLKSATADLAKASSGSATVNSVPGAAKLVSAANK